ncbi:MAG: sensor histidine kinase, partial [Nitrospinaceae bacterium]
LSLERRNPDTIVLQVGDSGLGIPPEHLDQIFDPFFTTKKNEVKGTGLGLSVSYGIVKNHGGKIECESKPGQGTTFSVVLPLQAAGV